MCSEKLEDAIIGYAFCACNKDLITTTSQFVRIAESRNEIRPFSTCFNSNNGETEHRMNVGEYSVLENFYLKWEEYNKIIEDSTVFKYINDNMLRIVRELKCC